MGEFASFGNCPPDAQVGMTKVKVGFPLNTAAVEPVFSLAPPHPKQEVARFGFVAFLFPIYIDVKVDTASDYAVTAIVHDPPGLGVPIRAKTTLWGNPADEIHDKERLTPKEANQGCKAICGGGERSSTIPSAERKAFMTNPSACQEMPFSVDVKSYKLPGEFFSASAPMPPITNCEGLPFAPAFEAEPTNHVAGAPTGLKTVLKVPQHLGEEEKATATMAEA